MKMFKKLMAVVLTGALAVSMLTGCALSDAIAENKAKDALENAWRTEKNETVDFKSGSFDSVVKQVKADIKAGTTKVADDTALVVATNDSNYTVVVVAEPKSATKLDNWKNLAKKVLDAATGSESGANGIYTTTGSNKKAKVDVITGVEGKNASDNSKSDDYTIFVFAATETAYNK